MNSPVHRQHWEDLYNERGEFQVSWFEDAPTISLELLRGIGAAPGSRIIDIGGGAARLVDALVRMNYDAVTVLDVSAEALSIARARLGEQAASVTWITADVTQWQPRQNYDVWHDRAAFHFLTEAAERAAYVGCLTKALPPGGHAIIGTFATDGPERCSGLPVARYDAESLSCTLGRSFALIETRRHDHTTPTGGIQRFLFSVFRRA
jgi:2-polyprenyl-3-methyl-5-hydroxy-6-metoxy-1,4-benzoquinol methylase